MQILRLGQIDLFGGVKTRIDEMDASFDDDGVGILLEALEQGAPFIQGQTLKYASKFEIVQDTPSKRHVTGNQSEAIEHEIDDTFAFRNDQPCVTNESHRERCHVMNTFQFQGDVIRKY